MLVIRMRRTGSKKRPHYRVVVTERRSPREGGFIETLGRRLQKGQSFLREIPQDVAGANDPDH